MCRLKSVGSFQKGKYVASNRWESYKDPDHLKQKRSVLVSRPLEVTPEEISICKIRICNQQIQIPSARVEELDFKILYIYIGVYHRCIYHNMYIVYTHLGR